MNTTKNIIPRNNPKVAAFLAAHVTSDRVGENVLWGILLVTRQKEALRALPASATQAERRETMKRVHDSMSI